MVVSVLLNGHTTWSLTKRLEKKLDGNCTKTLRFVSNKSWKQYLTKQLLFDHFPRYDVWSSEWQNLESSQQATINISNLWKDFNFECFSFSFSHVGDQLVVLIFSLGYELRIIVCDDKNGSWVKDIKAIVLAMALKCIRWWGSSSEDLGVWITPSFPLPPGSLWHGVVVPIRVTSMRQIDLFENYLC